MVSYSQRLVRGATYLGISTIIVSLLGYGTRLLLAKQLTVTEYGLVYAVIAAFSFLGYFLHFGLSNALERDIAVHRVGQNYGEIKEAYYFTTLAQLAVYGITGTAIILLAPKIAVWYLNTPDATVPLVLYAITFILTPLLQNTQSAFIGFQRQDHYAFNATLAKGTLLAGAALLLWLGFGVSGVFWAHIAAIAVTALIAIAVFTKKVFPQMRTTLLHFKREHIKHLVRFGTATTLTGVFGVAFGKLDTLLISIFLDLKQVALYEVAFPTASSLWGLVSVLTISLGPMIPEMWMKKDHANLNDAINRVYRYTLTALLPIAILLGIFAEAFLATLFGEDYLGASIVLRILCIGIILRTLTKVNSNVLDAINKPFDVTRYIILGGILNLVGDIILIPAYGIGGAAASTVASFGIVFLASGWRVRKHIQLKPEYKKLGAIIISGLGLGVVSYLVAGIVRLSAPSAAILGIIAGCIVYALLLLLLRAITLEEIREIARSALGATRPEE